jgi:hypothetical protein
MQSLKLGFGCCAWPRAEHAGGDSISGMMGAHVECIDTGKRQWRGV